MPSPRFIVSTGRCGSTLLASLLGAHPSVLNISELFAALQPRAFPPCEISGADFWTLLSRPQPAWTIALQHGIEPSEFAYRVDAGARFDRQTGVPPILAVCLPTLGADPDRLYREPREIVPTFRPAEIGTHYRTLFSWLATRLGKAAWVERSGGSLAYAGDIAARFKDGRFVHLYRNGCETALSMSEHTLFRMAIVRETLTTALGHDPYEPNATGPAASLPHGLERLLPDTFDPLAFRNLQIPPEQFGRRWSAMILLGTGRLAAVPDSNVCHVSYEESPPRQSPPSRASSRSTSSDTFPGLARTRRGPGETA